MSSPEIVGLHRITKKHLKDLCKKHKLYQTPHLNDQLYLHFQGFQSIENLEEYTGVKCLWLESNAISEIQGLENQKELKCLFLQNNLIKKIENLQYCTLLDTLNLSSNHITRIDNCGIDILPNLSTLNLSRNYLNNSAGLQELLSCKNICSLDLSHNRIDDILVVKIFASMPELRVLILQGNPVVSKVPQYRKTLILECKNLTYLDSRPVFPKDRACAEAWKRGGYEEERKEHDRWIKKDRQSIRDSINATLRLRQRHGAKDVQLLKSSDDEEDDENQTKRTKQILEKEVSDEIEESENKKKSKTLIEVSTEDSSSSGENSSSSNETSFSSSSENSLRSNEPSSKDSSTLENHHKEIENWHKNQSPHIVASKTTENISATQSNSPENPTVNEQIAGVRTHSEEIIPTEITSETKTSAENRCSEKILTCQELERSIGNNDQQLLKENYTLSLQNVPETKHRFREPQLELIGIGGNPYQSEDEIYHESMEVNHELDLSFGSAKSVPKLSKRNLEWDKYTVCELGSPHLSKSKSLSSDETKGFTLSEAKDHSLDFEESDAESSDPAKFIAQDTVDYEKFKKFVLLESAPQQVLDFPDAEHYFEQKDEITTDEKGGDQNTEKIDVQFALGKNFYLTKDSEDTDVELETEKKTSPKSTQIDENSIGSSKNVSDKDASHEKGKKDSGLFETVSFLESLDLENLTSDSSYEECHTFSINKTEEDNPSPINTETRTSLDSSLWVDTLNKCEEHFKISEDEAGTPERVLNFPDANHYLKEKDEITTDEEGEDNKIFEKRNVQCALEKNFDQPEDSEDTDVELETDVSSSWKSTEFDENSIGGSKNDSKKDEFHKEDKDDSCLVEIDSFLESLDLENLTSYSSYEECRESTYSLDSSEEVNVTPINTETRNSVDSSLWVDTFLKGLLDVNKCEERFKISEDEASHKNVSIALPTIDMNENLLDISSAPNNQAETQSNIYCTLPMKDIITDNSYFDGALKESTSLFDIEEENDACAKCTDKPIRTSFWANRDKRSEDEIASDWLVKFLNGNKEESEEIDKNKEILIEQPTAETNFANDTPAVHWLETYIDETDSALQNEEVKKLSRKSEQIKMPTLKSLIKDAQLKVASSSKTDEEKKLLKNEETSCFTCPKISSEEADSKINLMSKRQETIEKQTEHLMTELGEFLRMKNSLEEKRQIQIKEEGAGRSPEEINESFEEVENLEADLKKSLQATDVKSGLELSSVSFEEEQHLLTKYSQEEGYQKTPSFKTEEALPTYNEPNLDNISIEKQSPNKVPDLEGEIDAYDCGENSTTSENKAAAALGKRAEGITHIDEDEEKTLSWWEKTLAAARLEISETYEEPHQGQLQYTSKDQEEDKGEVPLESIREAEPHQGQGQNTSKGQEEAKTEVLESIIETRPHQDQGTNTSKYQEEAKTEVLLKNILETGPNKTHSFHVAQPPAKDDHHTTPRSCKDNGLALRDVITTFNEVAGKISSRDKPTTSQLLKDLIKNPLTKSFFSQTGDQINCQFDKMNKEKRERLSQVIDHVYSQKDEYDNTLEVVDGRLMIVERSTGALRCVPPPLQTAGSTKYTSCGVSTTQTICNDGDDSDSDDYGTGLSENDNDDIEQHASDTKIKKILNPPLVSEEGANESLALSSSGSSTEMERVVDNSHRADATQHQQFHFKERVVKLYNEIDTEVLPEFSEWLGVDKQVRVSVDDKPTMIKRTGKEEIMLMRKFSSSAESGDGGEYISELQVEFGNTTQTFMDLGEAALEDIGLIFELPLNED